MRRTALVVVPAVVLALALGACGGSGGGSGGGLAHSTSARTGPKIFATAGCGSCHTLAAAHSHGTVGPNLDDLAPSEETVADQVRGGGGGMPAYDGVLDDEQIQAVARYVAQSTG